MIIPKTDKDARHLWDGVIFLPLSKKDLDVRPVASAKSDEGTSTRPRRRGGESRWR